MVPKEFNEQELIERFASGTLPERWSFRLKKAMRPLYQKGQLVTVRRGLDRVGPVVCVVHCGRLAWRRVIARSLRGVLLRAEVSPFEDGWFSEVLGSIEATGLPATLAERLPGTWTRFWWAAAWMLSRTRGLSHCARCWRRSRPPFQVRRLNSTDRASYFCLLKREYGIEDSAVQRREFLPPNAVGLGLFLDDTLVGSSWLSGDKELGVVSSLLVDSRYRGAGGGTMLNRAALTEARAAGMRRVQAAVFVRNLASLRSAERAGLRRTGQWVTDPKDRLRASDLQLLLLDAHLGQFRSKL